MPAGSVTENLNLYWMLETAPIADRTRLTVFPSCAAAGTAFRVNGWSARTLGNGFIDSSGMKTTRASRSIEQVILENLVRAPSVSVDYVRGWFRQRLKWVVTSGCGTKYPILPQNYGEGPFLRDP